MSRPVTSAQLSVARSLVVHESRDAKVSFSLERIYTKMYDRLAPIIGATGVHALFMRAVERARAESSSVDFTPDTEPRDAARPSVEALERLSPKAAQDAASAITAKFLSLLLTFMGSDLTVQILRAAFRDIDIELKDP
jgi:hypothetical protein